MHILCRGKEYKVRFIGFNLPLGKRWGFSCPQGCSLSSLARTCWGRSWGSVLRASSTCQTQKGTKAAAVWDFFPRLRRSLSSGTNCPESLPTLLTHGREHPREKSLLCSHLCSGKNRVFNGDIRCSPLGSCMSIGSFFLAFRNYFTRLSVCLSLTFLNYNRLY